VFFSPFVELQEQNIASPEEEKFNNNGAYHGQDEIDSETSFGSEESSFLDRLGMKIDDSLHRIFTAYVIEHDHGRGLDPAIDVSRFSIGRFCAYNPTFTIVPTVAILFVLCFGSRYYTVTTDPVDLWVASNSRARLEKAYFDENFG
jgi:hypothetical protein